MTLAHRYQGGLTCSCETVVERHKLLVGVPCLIEGMELKCIGLLDTACSWSVLSARLVAELGCLPVPGDPLVQMSTRFGTYEGWLDRFDLTLPAEVGEALTISATWFVCPDWPGPLVLGWKGCLERLQLGLNPNEEALYFAPLYG